MVYMQDGKIQENGTYDELMQSDKGFAQLMSSAEVAACLSTPALLACLLVSVCLCLSLRLCESVSIILCPSAGVSYCSCITNTVPCCMDQCLQFNRTAGAEKNRKNRIAGIGRTERVGLQEESRTERIELQKQTCKNTVEQKE